jgi:hypothetical protein
MVSIDLYFGPLPRRAKKRTGYRPLQENTGLYICGFYGPTTAYFDKSWKMGDVEKVNELRHSI